MIAEAESKYVHTRALDASLECADLSPLWPKHRRDGALQGVAQFNLRQVWGGEFSGSVNGATGEMAPP